jgi:hypothetical protein
VVLERDMDALGLVCMGCSRRWTRPSATQVADLRERERVSALSRAASAARQAHAAARRIPAAAAT